jgi:hypothetical protein
MVFGPRDDLIKRGHRRINQLKARKLNPAPDAYLYGENELEGTHVLMLLKFRTETYGLPVNPSINPFVKLLDHLRPAMAFSTASTVLGLGISYMTNYSHKYEIEDLNKDAHQLGEIDTSSDLWRKDQKTVNVSVGKGVYALSR